MMNWNLVSCVLMIVAAINMAWLAYNQVQVTSSVNSMQTLLTTIQQEQASAHKSFLHDLQFLKELEQSREAHYHTTAVASGAAKAKGEEPAAAATPVAAAAETLAAENSNGAPLAAVEAEGSSGTVAAAGALSSDSADDTAVTARAKRGADEGLATSSSQQPVPLSAPTNPKTGQVCVDLMKVFGVEGYMGGITWEPYQCFPGLKQAFPRESEAAMKAMLKSLLVDAMSEVRGVSREHIDPGAYYLTAVKAGGKEPEGQLQSNALLQDPGFKAWKIKLQRVMASIMTVGDPAYLLVNCPDTPPPGNITYSSLPLSNCKYLPEQELFQKMGRFPAPHAPITHIVQNLLDGVCFLPPRTGFDSYGEFLMSRMMDAKWKTFNAGSLDEDAVLFLIDVLYEAKHVFLEQKWMGITAMQPPFDFFSITDIIWQTKPDVIIETGTANGGSALMWASILELAGLTNSRIITMDLQEPGTRNSFGFDATKPPAESDPTRHRLWSKYVRFIKGSTTDPGIVAKVKKLAAKVTARGSAKAAAAARAAAGKAGQARRRLLQGGAASSALAAPGARWQGKQQKLGSAGARYLAQSEAGGPTARKPTRVLVLLDSHHTQAHVAAEMEIYCPMASVGSYCVVEDTRMSRWTDFDPGPLMAIHEWLPRHPEFQMDRAKELLYTTHPQGYLKRVR